jgi:ATP-binding cassette subfamily A (ABC1) protein 3
VFWDELFRTSSLAISLFWQILVGWAITSAAVFSAMFFNKARISGIWSAIGFLIIALCGQLMDWGSPKTATVAVMSLLFPSMNYIFFTGYMCRYEEQGLPTDMLQAAKTTHDEASTSRVPGIILWLFLVLQIVIYPLLAVFAEGWTHGSKSKTRTIGISSHTQINSPAIKASGLTKIYPPTVWKKWFTRGKKEDVVAVENLDLVAHSGQILCLLGANGSGKTTTLDMIGGLQKLTSGTIHINAAPSEIG